MVSSIFLYHNGIEKLPGEFFYLSLKSYYSLRVSGLRFNLLEAIYRL